LLDRPCHCPRHGRLDRPALRLAHHLFHVVCLCSTAIDLLLSTLAGNTACSTSPTVPAKRALPQLQAGISLSPVSLEKRYSRFQFRRHVSLRSSGTRVSGRTPETRS